MSRTSDSRSAVASDSYRSNPFWEKKNNDKSGEVSKKEPDTLATENKFTERGGNSSSSDIGQPRELGRDGSGSRVGDSGDDV